MSIRRVVPNLRSSHLEESREFYAGFIGLNVAMDMGWIIPSPRQTRRRNSV